MKEIINTGGISVFHDFELGAIELLHLKVFLAWLDLRLAALYKKHGINIILLNDEKLLALNRQRLNHDYYTDIITDDLSVHDNELVADLYVSIDRVKENAGNEEVVFDQELMRVIIHGLLHTQGYQDKTAEQQGEMRKQENNWLATYENRRK